MNNKSLNSKLWLVVALVISMYGCTSNVKQELTPLQIQAFQTHEFEASKAIVFGSVVSVFQDLGYIVESADKDTGFITAGSASMNKTGFWEAMSGMASSGKTKVTAFVEGIRPGFISVRLNFVDTKESSSQYGRQSKNDQPILDPKPYQVAFDKIEEAVFIRKGAS